VKKVTRQPGRHDPAGVGSPLPPRIRRCWASSLGQRGRVCCAQRRPSALAVVHELMELEVRRGRGREGQA